MTDANEQSIPSRGSHGSGITERLRGWATADDSVWPSELMGEAAGEIDRLRLTDAELEAVGYFGQIEGGQYLDAANRHAAALRGIHMHAEPPSASFLRSGRLAAAR